MCQSYGLFTLFELPPLISLSHRSIQAGKRQQRDSRGAICNFLLFLTLLFYSPSRLLLPCSLMASALHPDFWLLVCSLATVSP